MNYPHLQDPRIDAILAQPFGRFSDGEFARRRQALTKVAEKHECDAILLCGEERNGTGVVAYRVADFGKGNSPVCAGSTRRVVYRTL